MNGAWLPIGFAALAFVWIALTTLAIGWVRSRRRVRRGAPVSVTVLKPLAGADAALGDNLESFFRQDHPSFELLFGLEDPDDPAAAVVRELIARYPTVRARLIVTAGETGQNPKVRNLQGLMRHATHAWVLVSDSNILAPPSYLSEATSAAFGDVGLVTHLFVGSAQGGFAGRLEEVELSGFVAGGMALPCLLGDACVVGKSMLFERATLDRLGGLGKVQDVLAEDFIIGKMIERGGRRVVVGTTILTNVLGRASLRQVFRRHQRWAMMRSRLRPLPFLLEPLTSPLLAGALLATESPLLGVGAALFLWALRDVVGPSLLGVSAGPMTLFMSPLRDLMALAVFVSAPFGRHVEWRGHRVRVGVGTLLFEERDLEEPDAP